MPCSALYMQISLTDVSAISGQTMFADKCSSRIDNATSIHCFLLVCPCTTCKRIVAVLQCNRAVTTLLPQTNVTEGNVFRSVYVSACVCVLNKSDGFIDDMCICMTSENKLVRDIT